MLSNSNPNPFLTSATQLPQPKHDWLQEIWEQPQVIQSCIDPFLSSHRHPSSSPLNLEKLAVLEFHSHRIHIVASGSSWHAALVGKYVMEQLAGIPTEVFVASEYVDALPPLTPHTLTILVCPSGESADIVVAAKVELQRRASQRYLLNSRLLALTNQPDSSLEQLADFTIHIPVGDKNAIAPSQTFVAQLTIFYILAVARASWGQTLSATQLEQFIDGLKSLPDLMKGMLSTQECHVRAIAADLAKTRTCILLGRGINYPIALEGALALKQTHCINARGYAAGEFNHGPKAIVSDNLPLIVIAPPTSAVYNQVLKNARDMKALGGRLIGITSPDNPDAVELFEQILPIPVADEWLCPVLSVIPLQLLAYYLKDEPICSNGRSDICVP